MQERAFLTGCGKTENLRSISSWKNRLHFGPLSGLRQALASPLASATELFLGWLIFAKQEHSQIYTRIWDRGFLIYSF